MNNHSNLLKFFRKHLYFTYVMIALISFSCTVKLPVSSIYATDAVTNEPVPWPEFVDENDNHRIRVTAMENIDKMLLFEVEVTNKNQEALHINPQAWQLDYFSNNYKSVADSTSLPLKGAQVNNVYQDIARRIVAARDGTTALIIAGVVVVVVIAIIAAGSGNDSGTNSSGDGNYVNYATNDDFNFCLNLGFSSYIPPRTDEWTTKQKITYYQRRGEQLKDIDMNPQVISKGESRLFGFFFPRKESAQFLRLNGSIDDLSYTWDFKHQSDGIRKILN